MNGHSEPDIVMKRTKGVRKADAILTSDWHLRETTPRCRTDDFWTAQWQKVAFVNELQHQHGCDVYHAGDLFHHWKPSPHLLTTTMEFIPDDFYTIYGQHDLPQHNWENHDKSGIHTLQTADCLSVVAGAHWGMNPAESAPMTIKDRSVLIWHRMVWQGKRLWAGQTDPSAVAVLRKYKEYDLILTGDNHKPFVEELEGRILVNPGSLTRQTADQIDHLPRVYLYYADTNTVEAVYLPVERDAVTREHIEKDEQRDQRIEAFISKMSDEWQAELSFEENLERFFKTNRVRESVKQIIYDAIELNLRKHLESSVVATNKHLKDEVTKMDLISLLRNCHPLYRHDYARLLYHDGLITEHQLNKFK